MRVFLNGGGDGANAAQAYQRFKEEIDKGKPLLYIPLAMEPWEYPGCLAWVREELACLGVEICMAVSGEELGALDFGGFGGVFLGGGNTFRLLRELKRAGGFQKLGDYIRGDGPVFGASAGAIVLGADIRCCQYADECLPGLENTQGLDVLGGVSLLCHYGSEGLSQARRQAAYLQGFAAGSGQTLLALSEEATLFLHGGQELIGGGEYALFTSGSCP